MYHKTLSISVLSPNPAVLAAVYAVVPYSRFSHDIKVLTELEEATFIESNLIILEMTETSSLAALLPPKIKGRARVALIASTEQIQAFDESDYCLIDALWVKPMSAARIHFELSRILKSEQIHADRRLYQQCLDTVVDSIPELIWFKDAKGSHLKVNDAFCSITEKTKEQVEGRGHYYIWDITEEEYGQGEYVCLESETQTMEAQKTCLFDEQVKTKNGMRQFKTYKSPLFDEDNSVMGTVGIAHDVTDLSNIKTELNIFINSMPYAVVALDAQNMVLDLNQKTEEYFGIQKADVLGGSFSDYRRKVLGNALANEREVHEMDTFSGIIGGVERTLDMRKTAIRDVFGNITGQLRIYRDITKERELEACVTKSANTDYLTGLYNRRYLYQYLGTCKGHTLTILSIDLDDFKIINDTYGHQMGDFVLTETAQVLSDIFADDVVVRMGGDEFIVVMVNERPLSEIHQQALVYLSTLQERLESSGDALAITASIGIATSSSPSIDIDELIRKSDAALYQAKRAGKSQCFIHEPN